MSPDRQLVHAPSGSSRRARIIWTTGGDRGSFGRTLVRGPWKFVHGPWSIVHGDQTGARGETVAPNELSGHSGWLRSPVRLRACAARVPVESHKSPELVRGQH